MNKYTSNEIHAAEGIINIIPLYEKKLIAINLLNRIPLDIRNNIIQLLNIIGSSNLEEKKIDACQNVFNLLKTYPDLRDEFKDFIKDYKHLHKIDI